MFNALGSFFKEWLPRSQVTARLALEPPQPRAPLKPIGFGEFLNLSVPPREMLLDPILPERSLAMLYAPRGVGKSWLGLSIGLAVASGTPLLRWSAPRKRRVLVVDGEMPLVSLQERLRALSVACGSEIPNHGFQVLAADNTDSGISLGTEEGQGLLDPLLKDVDLLILDNLSTLVTTGSENASDGWVAMQNWLLSLRRQGVAVLLIHHAGTNGRQRGTSRREDALDTVVALRRPDDYSPEQGARFEIHLEKLRNRIDGNAAIPFEARIETANEGIRWLSADLMPPRLKQAAVLLSDGHTVRQVGALLGISSSEAGRLRLRAADAGLLVTGNEVQIPKANGSRPN
jgi:putative DNA primase/helicase